MATISLQSAKAVGQNINYLTFPEAESQTFKRGQFVYLSSGYVTACADDAVSILGMAAEDANDDSAAGTHEISVALAESHAIFEANVYHGTPASAVTAITTPCNGANSVFALQVDSNKCYVDLEDTGHDAFLVIGLSPKDAVGDTYGRVLFKVIPSASQCEFEVDEA
jgi:hypothetical protein